MLTSYQLWQTFTKGHLDAVKRELDLYGTITGDNKWDEPEGHYKGANRATTYTHHGKHWTVEMLNGEVRALGYELLKA